MDDDENMKEKNVVLRCASLNTKPPSYHVDQGKGGMNRYKFIIHIDINI